MDFPADITLRKTRMKFELTFKVVLLFSYQGFVCSFLRHNFFILSHSEVFVKNFFYFAVSFFRKQLVHFIILFQECQVLFCD